MDTEYSGIIIYGVVMNVITFFYFGWDKMRAATQRRRVRERTLWILMILGGSMGGLLGMRIFRHKTRKLSFQAAVAVIVMAQVVLVAWFFMN